MRTFFIACTLALFPHRIAGLTEDCDCKNDRPLSLKIADMLEERFRFMERLDQALDKHKENMIPKLRSNGQFNCPKVKKFPRNCAEIAAAGHPSGIYTIAINGIKPFLVYCEEGIYGGNWIVIFRHTFTNSVFNLEGFGSGDLYGEYYIGKDKIEALRADEPQEVLFIFTDIKNVTKYIKTPSNESDDTIINPHSYNLSSYLKDLDILKTMTILIRPKDI